MMTASKNVFIFDIPPATGQWRHPGVSGWRRPSTAAHHHPTGQLRLLLIGVRQLWHGPNGVNRMLTVRLGQCLESRHLRMCNLLRSMKSDSIPEVEARHGGPLAATRGFSISLYRLLLCVMPMLHPFGWKYQP
jgi:hypothetical protein